MSVTVKVEFIGICTRIPAHYITPPPAGVAHRFVLVDASRGATINTHRVPPHDALLAIDPASIMSMGAPSAGLREIARGLWQLRGVALSIDHAEMPSRRSGAAPPFALPSMQKQAGGVAFDLDQDVVANGEAACYFDITQGQLSGSLYGEAATSTLYIRTPEAPRLTIRTFWDDSVTHIRLQTPAKIVIRNIGGFEDSTYDFLLHYKIAKKIPPHITPPGPAKTNSLSGLASGCSNSAYP